MRLSNVDCVRSGSEQPPGKDTCRDSRYCQVCNVISVGGVNTVKLHSEERGRAVIIQTRDGRLEQSAHVGTIVQVQPVYLYAEIVTFENGGKQGMAGDD